MKSGQMEIHALLEQDVHIWCATLVITEEQERDYYSILDNKEQARADRFQVNIQRRRYIAGRVILRQILSTYLSVAPALIEFSYNENGKPALNNLALQFNLSHSFDMAVYAITQHHPIGVDIERIDGDFKESLAQRFFNKMEFDLLNSLPLNQRADVFYEIWARKEAVLKAVGIGLKLSLLPQIIVSVDSPMQQIAMNAINWHLQSIDIAPGYKAAFATSLIKPKVQFKIWPMDTGVTSL